MPVPDKNIHPDQKYIEDLKKKKPVLINEIYADCYEDIEKFVLKNSGNIAQAKDLFQEALIALWEKVKVTEVVLTVPFGAYFYQIYRFKWLNYLNRDKHRINNTNFDDIEKYIDTVIDYFAEDDESIEERRLNIFSACFKQLSYNCQTMFNLKFQGKKSKEIAKIVERGSPNAVDVALLVCRRKLKACIEAHSDYKTLKM